MGAAAAISRFPLPAIAMGPLISALCEVLWRMIKADIELGEESRLGDTPERRATRHAWRTGFLLMFFVVVLVVVWQTWG